MDKSTRVENLSVDSPAAIEGTDGGFELSQHTDNLTEDSVVAFNNSSTSGTTVSTTDPSTRNQHEVDASTGRGTKRAYENGALSTAQSGSSEFEAIIRDAAAMLEKKLDNNRIWADKLLQELTIYVEALKEVHAEYFKIQQLEQQESDRLDQVEPDVEGATHHLLQHPLFGNMLPQSVGHLIHSANTLTSNDQEIRDDRMMARTNVPSTDR